MIRKLVSGGQTGVDRAALDVALSLGIPCGGWCPKGRLAEDGSIASSQLVAGGPDESIFQPEWSPDGVLHFVSDRTGWWNLYRRRDGHIEPLHTMEAEFGLPQWIFRMSTYGFESAGRIVCVYSMAGGNRSGG